MILNLIFLVITECVLTSSPFTPKPLPEDGRLNFTELSEKYGHRSEEHTVVTEDGYILTVFRLPSKRRPPVLLLHGLLDSADSYIIRGNESLAITLANRGYDVWAGNTRGNRYARRHIRLNPDTDPSFWDYSFHEHGYYDLAAITDYVLNTTGEKSIQSVGQSEGTTDHFVLGSLRPEYNDKFKLFIALAPSAYLSNLEPPLSLITELGPLSDKILTAFKIEELFKDKGVQRTVFELICNQRAITFQLCGEYFLQIGATDPKRLESEFWPTVIGHYPASSSRKSIIHYSQVALSKRFALFDYGSKENLKRYGLIVPPDYNLRQFKIKTALFVAKNDQFSQLRDVEYLRTLLQNVVHYHLMEPETWNHFDYNWGNDLPDTLFPHILLLLEKYS